jgi:hypothetical protein
LIVKNISPYPVKLTGLGNKTLMPGEESDLSSFTQHQKDNCVELQEGFRRGELICIGIGRQNQQEPDAHLRIARARIQENQPQPLIEVPRGRRIPNSLLDQVTNPTIQDETTEETSAFPPPKPPPIVNRRPVPKIFQEPTGIMENDRRGNLVVRPVPPPKPREEAAEPSKVVPKTDSPKITPERIKEIWAQRCISFRTNGQKCRRWATKESEYCEQHMPAEEKERRKKSKKQDFFKE